MLWRECASVRSWSPRPETWCDRRRLLTPSSKKRRATVAVLGRYSRTHIRQAAASAIESEFAHSVAGALT